MPDPEYDAKNKIEAFCSQFESECAESGSRTIPQYLDQIEPEYRDELLKQLLNVEVKHSLQSDKTVVPMNYIHLGENAVNHVEEILRGDSPTPNRITSNGQSETSLNGGIRDEKTIAPGVQSASKSTHPVVGRYRTESVLGEGGFGLVYKAYDEQLQRHVAIKVPHSYLVNNAEDATDYLTEARVVASLEHPHIVPVYDVGQTDEYPCYIVSRYVEGTNLWDRVKDHQFSFRESAELISKVAEALHHAHLHGLVHRDIKPGNILMDNNDQPFVVDFGLALREQDLGKNPELAGTPAYMSPEQARGEGHRVDGRSDIYSLGVVLYRLLVGQIPFTTTNDLDLLVCIANQDVVPPRQIEDHIPRELDRICLKALARRASERYSTAQEFADDLKLFVAECTEESARVPSKIGAVTNANSTRRSGDPTQTFEANRFEPIQVVPRGLRSYDNHDSDFFMELLPGPRDRNGLPESVRFWKKRIEDKSPDNSFSVGLIYGPSGCGKSSLVKAGLIPKLSPDIISLYIEATPDGTEQRILNGIRKSCPALRDLDLVDSLKGLRRGQGLPVDKKVLIVVDQFEQWLHSNRDENTELVQALRQCDSEHVQCILMVRDDFWMAATRFMAELEVRLVEGQNSAAVDLFPIAHAKKVLRAFGRAYGVLGQESKKITDEQRKFITMAVDGLAEEGKVISVRLALFAEMMKSKPWSPDSLEKVGGTSGVGANFLEETFGSYNAPARHLNHQKAVRLVLHSLLPDAGTNIKGHMRSYQELLEVSGYAGRSGDFEELIQILDSEIRLITLTDPEGLNREEGEQEQNSVSTSAKGSGEEKSCRFYQLTHDYLVPALRDWLTRKQKETRQGRAEIILDDRASIWANRRENRQLPSAWQWLQICWYTKSKQWSDLQQTMMKRAGRVHGLRLIVSCFLLVIGTLIGISINNQIAKQQRTIQIEGVVGGLVNAEPDKIIEIIEELDQQPELADEFLAPLLSSNAQTADQKRARLHAQMASVSRDPSLVKTLKEEFLTCKIDYAGPIRELLQPYAEELKLDFWTILRSKDENRQRRFRAAIALAEFEAASKDSWTQQDLKFVTKELVSSNAEFQPLLRRYLRRLKDRLIPFLKVVFQDKSATESQRISAARGLVDFAEEEIQLLTTLLTEATAEQFRVLFPTVKSNSSEEVVATLAQTAEELPDKQGVVERIAFGQRRANAAIALLQMGQIEKSLRVFDWSDDPEALTQFVFRIRQREVPIATLLDSIDFVRSNSAKNVIPTDSLYGLLLALGEFELEEVPKNQRENLLAQIADSFANDPRSGVHGASRWLLQKWGQSKTIRRLERVEVPYSPGREWFRLKVELQPNKPPDAKELPPRKAFYYTFIVYKPGYYWIGSPDDEPERESDEARVKIKVTRPFAVLDREVTFEETIAFSPQEFSRYLPQLKRTPQHAAGAINWYHAVYFCRWLGQQAGIKENEQPYVSPDSLDVKDYPRETDTQGLGAVENWPVKLDCMGFRIPTETEWEIMTRSGARTAYCFGSDSNLLKHYGWSVENSGKQGQLPRQLRPNVRGVFDCHGNMSEWNHDWYTYHLGKYKDSKRVVRKGEGRIRRGGTCETPFQILRSSSRSTRIPYFGARAYGIRLAVSLPAETKQ